MITKETTTIISLVKTGIILNPTSKNKEQISFEDVSKIHICIRKRKLILKTFLIGYFIFTLFCMQYLNMELSIFSISDLIFSIVLWVEIIFYKLFAKGYTRPQLFLFVGKCPPCLYGLLYDSIPPAAAS